MWKMFQNFNIAVDYLLMLTIFHVQNVIIILINDYVIFLYRNISMNCKYFIFFGFLLMLTYSHVENVPEFQYCF